MKREYLGNESLESYINSSLNSLLFIPQVILLLFGYKQLIKQPANVTTESCTLTDIILSNNESIVLFTDVVPLGLSDHDTVACVRKINWVKYEYQTIKNIEIARIMILKNCKGLKLKDMSQLYVMPDPNSA